MNAPVREGEVLAGKYHVDKVLGVGGMGVVVAAHHIELDDKVAIKFLLPDTLGNPDAVARFAREARAAVKIKSEHVARVSDVGKLENGAPYMVMEYLDGGDLSAWISQRGALPIAQAVEFVLQACEAIAEAHTIGIVHRDLKPANLFVIRRPDGQLSVKVLDFGISKLTSLTGSGGDAGMTKTSALMGSPLYMSPEQMQSSKNVDARGDIWALGVILYELVAGSVPFLGETMPELILNIMSAAPTPLRNKRPDAPDGLEAVILRCLDKDRGKRFQTIGEFAAALLPFGPKRSKASVERISGLMMAAGLAGSALALPPSSDQTDAAAGAGTAASWGRTSNPGVRGKVPLFAGAGALLVGIAALLMRKPAITERVEPSAVAPTIVAAPPVDEQSHTVAPPMATVSSQPVVADEPTPPQTNAGGTTPMGKSKAHSSPAVTPATLTGSRPPLAERPPAAQPRAAPVAAPAPQPVAPPPAAKAAPKPAPAAPNCTPNYTFDANGNKHFKPECFH